MKRLIELSSAGLGLRAREQPAGPSPPNRWRSSTLPVTFPPFLEVLAPMARHRLAPTRDTVTDVFCRELPPVLTVSPGDTVMVRSLDASGYLARQQHPGDRPPTMFSAARGHCLTGP